MIPYRYKFSYKAISWLLTDIQNGAKELTVDLAIYIWKLAAEEKLRPMHWRDTTLPIIRDLSDATKTIFDSTDALFDENVDSFTIVKNIILVLEAVKEKSLPIPDALDHMLISLVEVFQKVSLSLVKKEIEPKHLYI